MTSSRKFPHSCVAFDVDGTLVDTEQSVIDAYRQHGITMPKEAWGRAWHEWLVPLCDGDWRQARILHMAKNKTYLETLRLGVKQLPPAEVAWELHSKGLCDVAFLTGASSPAVDEILVQLGFQSFDHLVLSAATWQHKIATLIEIPGGKAYVDNDMHFGKMIADQADVKFIGYDGQTKDELMGALWTP